MSSNDRQLEAGEAVSCGNTSESSEKPTGAAHWWSRGSRKNEVKETISRRGTFREETAEAFKGRWRYNGELSYRRPTIGGDLDGARQGPQVYEYKDTYGRITEVKQSGIETYLSGTRFKPRELIVQASTHGHLQPLASWNRRRISGSVPAALKISEWALSPAFDSNPGKKNRIKWIGIPVFLLRTLVVALPLQLYMSFPIFTPPWEEDSAEDTYMDWPGRLWEWPKFAVNPLDMSPASDQLIVRETSSKPRLLRPRLLIVEDDDGNWVQRVVAEDARGRQPYIMVSFTNEHYKTSKPYKGPDNSEIGREKLRKIARKMAKDAGVRAYWLDFDCRADTEDQDLLDSDVNRYCDVVRGTSRVIIALPDKSQEAALVWGRRMWTLPEGLLAPGDTLLIHYGDPDTDDTSVVAMSKVEMAALMWDDPVSPSNSENIQGTRLLAEHYTGVLQLSRLQLMSTALGALWDRRGNVQRKRDDGKDPRLELAHALMGLLHTRVDPVPGNTLFQDLAKLSLLNDSDQIVEKMISLLPVYEPEHHTPEFFDDRNDPFRTMVKADEFNTHLWDIHPTCEIVGIDKDDMTVVLNDCRAIPIRWKKFPRMLYKRKSSFKKFVAEVFLRSGAWWFVTGAVLAFQYAGFWISDSKTLNNGKHTFDDLSTDEWIGLAVLFFIAVGSLLSLVGPVSVRVLYGGAITRPALHLTGFEGTMPIEELETIIFGNCNNRLAYHPSSTPFSMGNRDTRERIGTEPLWVKYPTQYPSPPLRPGYRLFTLIDTGSLCVSIFQARKPPTVALLCGREGGMLRSVLCSWNSERNSLNKESVIRMPTDVFDIAVTKGWLKLNLTL